MYDVTLKTFQVGDQIMRSFPVSIMEYADYANRDYDGVLGANFLFEFVPTIDTFNKRLILEHR